MRKIRLYIEEALSQGIGITLNLQQSHYIRNVMRLKKSDTVIIFNGKDGEWQGEIIKTYSLVEIQLKESINEQQYCTGPHLYCAIVKNIALNNIIRQATEMGVRCIQFILTNRTIVNRINLIRAKMQSIEAAEQCERMDIPQILPPINFQDALQSHNKCFILCDQTGTTIIGTTIDEAFRDKKEISVIIGPEGGFTADELDFADSFCNKLSLGKRILRVDTAVVVALAYLEARATKY